MFYYWLVTIVLLLCYYCGFICFIIGSILRDRPIIGNILGNRRKLAPELDEQVEVCVGLEENVTTSIDIPVTFMPQFKLNSTRPATRMLKTCFFIII